MAARTGVETIHHHLHHTAFKAGRVSHRLSIASKGAGRKWFDLGDAAIRAFAQAIASIEKDPAQAGAFVINESLTLASEPPGFALLNCEVKYKFPAFSDLKALWERIQERALIAKLFN